jgi:REP element-mobilizing transposase RayT
MPFYPKKHHRRSIRLREYDYSQAGAYFIAVCTWNKECLLGSIENGEMVLNDAGRVADKCWYDIPVHFPHVALDKWIIMPNHVHGILFIVDTIVGAKNFSPLPDTGHLLGTSKTIGAIIRGFKIGVTKWMRQHNIIHEVWQRNFYDHIIRNENSMHEIREYIRYNPIQWERDELNPFNNNQNDTIR